MAQQQELTPSLLAAWQEFVAVAELLERWPVAGVDPAQVNLIVSSLGFAGLQSLVDAVWLQRLEELVAVCSAGFWQALNGSLLEGAEGAEEKSAYRDVRAALLLADEHFEAHIGLARMVDVAASRTGDMPSRTAVEAAYRESFTSRIMADASPAFHRKMRLFFQHNIASWGDRWRPATSGRHHKKRQRAEDSETPASGAGSRPNAPGGTPGGEESACAVAAVSDGDGSVALDADGSVALDADGSVALDARVGSSGNAIGGGGDGAERGDEELHRLWGILHRQGWMTELRDVFTEALQAQIAAHVRSACAGSFHTPLLAALVAWKDEVLRQRLGELQAICMPPPMPPKPQVLEGGLSSATQAGASAAAAASEPGAPVPVTPWFRSHGQSKRALESTLELESMLDLSVHEVFCGERMSEAFDMVAVYPGSDWALRDMQAALAVTGLHWQFAAALRAQVSQRLLHPGADTDDVLEMLVCTVKALLVLDPQGAMAEAVAGPIKRYLQGRRDTVHCVLRALTGDDESDFSNELRRGSGGSGAGGGPPGQVGDGSALGEVTGDNEDDPAVPEEEWMPAAREGGAGMGSSGGGGIGKRLAAPPPRRHDMLGMLVGIYGSKGKDVFVAEFRQMMVDWLLGNADYDSTRERRILEELKLRFGEDRMKQCDVMVRDVDDSKRINANVRERLRQSQVEAAAAAAASSGGIATPTVSPNGGSTQLRDLVAGVDAAAIDTLLVSQQFWPALPAGEVRIHPRMQAAARKFAEAYEVLKTPRKLAWRPHLGHVDLELKLAGSANVTKVTVTPAHAALIMHFEDRAEWTLDELTAQVGSSAGDVQKKMARWVNLGVLREGPVGRYALVTEGPPSAAVAVDSVDFRDDEGGEDGGAEGGDSAAAGSAAVSARQQVEEAAERYLVGMLGNLGRLSPEKIHNMLNLFMSTGDQRYDMTLAELVVLLRRLCALGRLEQAGAEYRLPPRA